MLAIVCRPSTAFMCVVNISLKCDVLIKQKVLLIPLFFILNELYPFFYNFLFVSFITTGAENIFLFCHFNHCLFSWTGLLSIGRPSVVFTKWPRHIVCTVFLICVWEWRLNGKHMIISDYLVVLYLMMIFFTFGIKRMLLFLPPLQYPQVKKIPSLDSLQMLV